MVKLKNITRTDSYIICDAYVEDCMEPVRLSYNAQTGEFSEFQLPKGYEYCDWHILVYAKRFLNSLIYEQNIPTEQLIMWY